eukprot:1758926-Alexandrium_andersonii.AAC.1
MADIGTISPETTCADRARSEDLDGTSGIHCWACAVLLRMGMQRSCGCPVNSQGGTTGVPDGLGKSMRCLAHLLGTSWALASGLGCLAEVDLTALLLGPPSAKYSAA